MTALASTAPGRRTRSSTASCWSATPMATSSSCGPTRRSSATRRRAELAMYARSAARLLLGSLAACLPLRAAAHPGPGWPPEFAVGDCITVVDQRDTPTLEFAYTVMAD